LERFGAAFVQRCIRADDGVVRDVDFDASFVAGDGDVTDAGYRSEGAQEPTRPNELEAGVEVYLFFDASRENVVLLDQRTDS